MEHLKIPINDLRKITVNMYVAKKIIKISVLIAYLDLIIC